MCTVMLQHTKYRLHSHSGWKQIHIHVLYSKTLCTGWNEHSVSEWERKLSAYFCTITSCRHAQTVDRNFAAELKSTSAGTQTALMHENTSRLLSKSHCRYLSLLNICGWIIITHTWSFIVDSAGCLSRAAFTSRWKKWKSGITFMCLTWTVFVCLTCRSLLKLGLKFHRNVHLLSLSPWPQPVWTQFVLIFELAIL